VPEYGGFSFGYGRKQIPSFVFVFGELWTLDTKDHMFARSVKMSKS